MTAVLLPAVTREGEALRLPGLASAHSHAFQRALRGRTQRQATAAGSFWSWRGLMYDLAARLNPDDVFHISRFAFMELALSGVTALGEFHYLHHAPDGRPYADRLEMAEAVIRAALEVGIRLTLIRTAYLRGGYQQQLAAAQRRFYDPDADSVLADVAELHRRYAQHPLIGVGIAAHSIRAVPLPQVEVLARYAAAQGLPFHMHVAEQRAELEESRAEYGQPPVALLAAAGLLGPQFVGVHATHLQAEEIAALGAAGAFVCLCRTTERDLGDGLPPSGALHAAGVKLCVGVDSHAAPDAFEEIRAIELDERSRQEARHQVADAPALLDMGTRRGYEAIGMGAVWAADSLLLDASDPALADAPDDLLPDAAIFAGLARALREVRVGGQPIIEGGRHPQQAAISAAYRATLRKLSLL